MGNLARAALMIVVVFTVAPMVEAQCRPGNKGQGCVTRHYVDHDVLYSVCDGDADVGVTFVDPMIVMQEGCMFEAADPDNACKVGFIVPESYLLILPIASTGFEPTANDRDCWFCICAR